MNLPIQPALTWSQGMFLRNAAPHRIIAGAIHYFRVHPTQWRDRLERLVSLGVNTLDTYVAWNFHQPRQEMEPDFSGWRDLGRFIDLAGELGLDVIVRPGPYICAEWDNGGFPAWVTSAPGVRLRRRNDAFERLVGDWFDQLVPVIASRQASRGGPVVAVQVENEYGSYGDDASYIRWNRDALLQRGITELLFTADGGTDFYLDGGSIPELLAAATLGSRGAEAFETWQRRRPGEPFFAVEFWNGWFDHWGENHHVRDSAEVAAEVGRILDLGGSICLYMAHGGTNFGLGSGCNHDGKRLQPTVSSYDSDAPIAEDGALTAKFHALRPLFHAALGRDLPELPEHLSQPGSVLPAATLPLTRGTDLLELARSGGRSGEQQVVRAKDPLSFEELGLPSGLVMYRSTAVLPAREFRLKLPGLADRATVWIDGALAGRLDDSTAADGLAVEGNGLPASLEILVESLGHINYGPLTGAGKGLPGGVLVDQRYSFDWEHTILDLEAWGAAELGQLAAAHLDVDEPADAHVALPGSGKGFLWVNGSLVGRYWGIGPQQTLYVPGGFWRQGRNEIHVLELEAAGSSIELRERACLGDS